ncbi:restriction endonuclease subunit S [Prochlorococcus marinus]|uniref:restriction endonuclease subunit S n=1 Tax=Prochlorococcus marinus TaxID=1219 RepID=UPI0022B4BC76|nr:restriction endonuclease subunit S [Prochlorococcus marinus]
MVFEWRDFRLGDLTTWSSGTTPSKQNPSFWGGDIPWISGTVMRSKNLCESELYLTQEGLDNKGKLCKKNSVLLLVRGDLFNRIPISIATKSLSFNQDIKAINSVSDDLLQHYIYYLLEGNKKRLSNIVEFTGLGAGKLDTKLLQDLTFKIPSIDYQESLINFFTSIDSKIELINKNSETLEALAKTLFKSWFIDFDPVRAKSQGCSTGLPNGINELFPDSFEESEFGDIPTGWKLGNLDQIALNPRETAKPFQMDSSYRYIGLEHMPRESIALSDSGTAENLASNKNVFKKGDILFGKLRPYFKKTGCAQFDGVCSTDIVVVREKFKLCRGFICFLLASNTFIDFTVALSSGTRMPRTSWNQMCEFLLPIPQLPLVQIFGEVVSPILDKIRINSDQSISLSSVRNTLLPKLISGELRIPDAEKMLEEVGI